MTTRRSAQLPSSGHGAAKYRGAVENRDAGACERSKALFNAHTGLYVMWMHLEENCEQALVKEITFDRRKGIQSVRLRLHEGVAQALGMAGRLRLATAVELIV